MTNIKTPKLVRNVAAGALALLAMAGGANKARAQGPEQKNVMAFTRMNGGYTTNEHIVMDRYNTITPTDTLNYMVIKHRSDTFDRDGFPVTGSPIIGMDCFTKLMEMSADSVRYILSVDGTFVFDRTVANNTAGKKQLNAECFAVEEKLLRAFIEKHIGGTTDISFYWNLRSYKEATK